MNECRRIFSDRKRRIAILCIPILCLALFFYQKCDGNFGALVTEAQEYRALLDRFQGSSPEEIVQAFADTDIWMLSEHEQRLLTQAEHLRDYPAYLERVQKQALQMQATSLFGGDPNSFLYRNIVKTAKDFADCSAEGLCLGNDRAVQDWLEFSLADWGFLAAILLLTMSFLEERKKGLAAIIRACPAGRGKLQGSRLLVLLLYSAGMTLLLYYLPLALSLCIDGGWADLARPVQSMAEFRRCTVPMSIAEFLLRFFFVKTACGFLLGTLIWFFLGFLEQMQLCWLLTAAGLAVEYLLYTLIPAQSLFSPLRYINVFSFVFAFQLYTQYVNINFFSFPVGQRLLLLGLLIALAILLAVAIQWLLTKRYPFGNRDLLGKWLHLWNRCGDALRRHLGLYGFEWYKLLFLNAGGLFLIFGILLTQNIRCNSGSYNRMEDVVYNQYVSQVQGPVSQSTFDYIAAARQELETAELDTSEFEAALDRLEQKVSNLDEGAWLVNETMFMNIYGEKAWWLQRKNGLLALIVLVACLSPLYACEQSGDVRKVLRSTPGGRKRLFGAKYAVALSVAALAWLLVFGKEWQAAAKLLGNTVLSAPCSSIGVLKGFPMTVGRFLVLLYLIKGLCLLIPMHLCMLIGDRSRGFEKSFLISGLALLIPAAAYSFGVNAFQAITPLPFLSGGSVLLTDGAGIFQFAVWTILSTLSLLAARRLWCRMSLR